EGGKLMPEWLVILFQSIGIFFIVFLFVRLIGKRQITQLAPFHVVTYIAIGVIAAALSLNLTPNIAHGFIALGVWLLLPLAMTFLVIRSKWLHDLIEGKEKIFIKRGKIMEENLQKERYTPEELLQQLRSKNVFSLADVEFAVLEPTGEINPMLKADKKPITAKDLGEKIAPQVEPQTIILDGNIMNESLANIGLNRQWLETELDKAGISPENIFVAQVNAFGELYIDQFNDAIQLPQPKVRELLYATLQKAQADLYGFALDTNEQKVKESYYQDAEQLEKLLLKLRPFLLH
ncbi:MAG: DUF421 domain-containing protein, partial [Bacillota bacterium]|nr:DUF421 domain-containing protein [Bacillota bacterium]